MKDNVNHPDHYKSSSGLEAIDVIEAFTAELSGLEAVCTGNALKYLLRWKKKNGVEDLKKARWYLNRMINSLESGGAETDPKLGDRRIVFKFDNKSEAEEFIDTILCLERAYKYVTISDVCDIAGYPSKFGDNEYGWYDLTELNVTGGLDHYVVLFPQPTKIKRNN